MADAPASVIVDTSAIAGTVGPRRGAPQAPSFETLNEPIHVTILRDVKVVGWKLWHVLLPRGRGVHVLRDWDLWGPLVLCLVLAFNLQLTAPKDQAPLMFAIVFVIVWCGAGVVTINAQLLGGTISFFQSVCVLGYCMFPIVLASLFVHIASSWLAWRVLLVVGSFLWAATASVGFLADIVPANRKLLATYPVTLFYSALAWLVFISAS